MQILSRSSSDRTSVARDGVGGRDSSEPPGLIMISEARSICKAGCCGHAAGWGREKITST